MLEWTHYSKLPSFLGLSIVIYISIACTDVIDFDKQSDMESAPIISVSNLDQNLFEFAIPSSSCPPPCGVI